MDSEVKARITADMALNGFSKAYPIHIFFWNGHWVLCDGHTRFASAVDLKLKYIWAQVHTFTSIKQALLYSMKSQFNRRNTEDKELLRQFEILRQEEIDGRKLTAAEMSERLKKSKRHIFKLQEVFSKCSKEQLKDLREGHASINKIYMEIKKQEQEKVSTDLISATTPQETPVETVSVQKIEQIEQTVQSKLQKDLHKKHRELQDKELELKQKEAKISKQLSDKQILLIGAKYALIQKAKGKSIAEILSSDSFEDSVKATSITFADSDLELLKAI